MNSMQRSIIDLIKAKGGGVTCVELCNEVPEFTGDLVWSFGHDNIVLWTGVSSSAIDAINNLLNEKKIVGCQSIALVYAIDGEMLQIPIAKNPKRKYKNPHWFPVVFWLVDQIDTSRMIAI